MALAAAAAAVGLIAASCAGERGSERVGPVRIATALSLHASVRIAERRGHFAAHGVEIEWIFVNRPSGSLPELASDQIDVVMPQVSIALFNIIGRGEPVRIVADRGHHASGACATSAILLRAGLDPFRLPADLRVSATPALVEEFMLDRARQLLGGEAELWRLTDLPRGTESVALAGGAVDLMQADEPALTRILDEGLARVWRTYAELQPEMQSHVLVFGPRLLERERDLGARFLAGYLEGERELAAGRNDENVAAMAEALDLDPALARRICWPSVRADLSIDVESLELFQRWAADKGLLDRVVPAEDYWDGELARRALGLAAASSR